jgi:hypothetical protein
MAMTPASWPWARRSRLSTGAMACSSIFMSGSLFRFSMPLGVYGACGTGIQPMLYPGGYNSSRQEASDGDRGTHPGEL